MANSSFSWERLSNQIQSHTRIRNRRRNDVDDEETNEDMSVFGYQCKLYRDDDKYRWIQSGKHLIPWMGRDELRIDRFVPMMNYPFTHLANVKLEHFNGL